MRYKVRRKEVNYDSDCKEPYYAGILSRPFHLCGGK